MNPAAPLVTLLEKALSTYVQALIALLLVHDTIGADVLQTAAIAALPAALTVVMNGLPTVPPGMPFYVDLLLRAIRTYVAAFLGVLVAMPVFHLDFTAAVAAATAALPTVLAFVKGELLGKRVGDGTTAAVVPLKYDATSRAAVPQAA